MQVTFYKFSKRSNSTKRPIGGTSYQCTLRAPSGIVDPVIVLQESYTTRPDYNYAYIADFGRFYWIEEWTFDHGGLWAASMHVDPLASWKTEIGAKQMYVLRASASSNGRVIDSKYPTLTTASSYRDSMSSITVSNPHYNYTRTYASLWNIPLSSGYYYLGVAGDNATGVSWYCLDAAGFKTVVAALYAYAPADMSDVSAGVAKQLADPMQYIVACYWLPLPVLGINFAQQDISFGRFTITGVSCCGFDPVADMMNFVATFPIRKHPQAATRGVYLNQAPTSKYRVGFYPFGTFDLDASLMIDDATVTAKWWIDYTTGDADLILSVTNTYVGRYSATMGVPIRLNQANVDYIGGAKSIAQAAGGGLGMLGSLAMGNIGGFASGAASVVGGFFGAAEAANPTISSIGGGGNFLPYNAESPKIYSDFYNIADELNAEIGRPLCQATTPATLGGGYIQALEGELEAPATRSELDMIAGYLTGGFFYE